MAGEEDKVHGPVGETPEEAMIYVALISSIALVVLTIIGALP
ncbi:hypothetical protein ABMA32_22395 [Mesorhizobium sp. VNQ89]